MSHSKPESEFATVSEAEITGNSFVRVLDGRASRKITCTNFADVMNPLLQTLGFLTDTSNLASITQNREILTKTANYTIALTNSVILCDTASTGITITLPSASDAFTSLTNLGQQFSVKRITTDVNKVTIAPAGAELIDGNTQYDLVGPNLVSITFISNGTSWFVVG